MNNKKEKLDENPVEFSNSQMGSDQPLTKSGESSEILFEQTLLRNLEANIQYMMEKSLERIQKIEDRLEEADLEDMTDRLEIVEDADADNRIYEVESDLEELDTRVGEVESRLEEAARRAEERKSND